MSFKIDARKIVIFFPFIILLIFCSSYSSGLMHRTMEGYLPYINLVIVICGLMELLRLKDFRFLVGAVLIVIGLVAICMINGTSIGSLAAFLTCVFSLFYGSKIRMTDELLKGIVFVGIVYQFLALLRCGTYFEKWGNGEYAVNPNTICICMFIFMIYVNAYFFIQVPTTRRKIMVLLYNIITFYCVFKYGSRTVLAAMIVFFLLMFFVPAFCFDLKKTRLYAIVLVILGILFPYAYINIPKSIALYITGVTGKSFYSGREIIWARLFAAFSDKQALLIGPGSYLSQSVGTLMIKGSEHIFSMHNAYLGIMLNFGLAGVAFFVFALILAFRVSDSRISRCFTIGYLCCMIIGFAEVIMTYSYYVIVVSLLASIRLEKRYKDVSL